MNPTIKRLIAGAAAAVTLLGGMTMASSAMADTIQIPHSDLEQKVPLTVQSDKETLDGRSFNAIPLATYISVKTDGTAITGFDLKDGGYASAIDNALSKAGIATTGKAGADGYAYDKSNPMVWVVQNLLDSANSPYAGKLRDFLTALGSQTNVKTGGTVLANLSQDKKSMSANVAPGVYAVFDTSESGQASITMMNGTGVNATIGGQAKYLNTLRKADGTTSALGTVSLKTHGTTITKKITAAETGTVENDGKSAETAIGKKITFQMTSSVPNWTGYDKYYYAINDTYSKGLTFNVADADMTVKIAGQILVKETDYKVTTKDGGFSIVFLNGQAGASQSEDILPNKTKFPVGAAVTVTYVMTLNKNAIVHKAETNSNEVEYSRNPNVWTDHEKKPGDTVRVYTGQFTLTKTDSDKKPLAGAEFKVYENNATDPVKFVKVSDNEYRKADKTETGIDTIVSTDKLNGVIKLTGLDGSYKVKETKSPFNTGVLPEATLTLKVDQGDGTKDAVTSKLTAFTGDKDKLVSKNDDGLGITVINAKNIVDLPKTGATWLVIYSTMTVLLAGFAFILMRRRA